MGHAGMRSRFQDSPKNAPLIWWTSGREPAGVKGVKPHRVKVKTIRWADKKSRVMEND